jgi:hypothetical protein
MLRRIAYTGTHWGEALELEREFLVGEAINLEWQPCEIQGKYHRLSLRGTERTAAQARAE